MFGYVIADFKKLSKEERIAYDSYYCGLCKTLSASYGKVSALTLTYDMTFLVLVLTSVYDAPSTPDYTKCLIHPAKPHPTLTSEFTDYAADMSIVLSYYNFLDDWNDDKNWTALMKSKIFCDKFAAAAKRYPKKCQLIKKYLDELTKIEQNGDLTPDSGANRFGNIMRVIFDYQTDEFSAALSAFGFNLGKFIYIMDASLDFKRDIKAKKYNPLVCIPLKEHEDILNMIMADCVAAFNNLPIQNNKSIIENIIYSGIWTEFYLRRKTKAAEAAESSVEP